MSKADTWENGLLLLLFQNANCSEIGDATGLRGSSAAGNLHVSLHVADPGDAGNQSTSETVYTNYGRIAVARTSAGWTVTGNNAINNAAITFNQCGATGNTISHFGVGTNSTGAGKLLYSGSLTSNLAVSSGITPQFAAGNLTVTED
jgi:hypothetical protein